MSLRLLLLLIFMFTQSLFAKDYVIGDLEGDFTRFEKFLVEHPDVFEKGPSGWRVINGHNFIFMGDAVDRGDGSIRIVRTLMELKNNSPENTKLILGNRDINKLWVYQLIKKYEGEPIPEFLKQPYRNYLNKHHGFDLKLSIALEELQEIVSDLDNPVFRLKVILEGMNAADAFQGRFDELKLLFPDQNITNDFVYRNFLDDWKKGGEFFEYLKQTQVGAIIDNTVYVHGAITPHNYGLVPGEYVRQSSMEEWIKRLNSWGQSEILNLGDDPLRDASIIEYHKKRNGKAFNNESVMYGRYSDSSGNPKLPQARFLKKLKGQGINRIVVGHTPVGEYPLSLRVNNFEVVLSDVSYSTISKLPLIEVTKDRVYMETQLKTGEVLKASTKIENHILPTGYRLRNDMRVVGKVADTDLYHVMRISSHGGGFSSHYTNMTVDEIFEIGLKVDLDSGLRNCEMYFIGR